MRRPPSSSKFALARRLTQMNKRILEDLMSTDSSQRIQDINVLSTQKAVAASAVKGSYLSIVPGARAKVQPGDQFEKFRRFLMGNRSTFLVVAAAVILPITSIAQGSEEGRNRGNLDFAKQVKREAPVHARRETVQTKNVKKPLVSDSNPAKTVGVTSGQSGMEPTLEEQRAFSRSGDARTYDNGVQLRPSLPVRIQGTSVFFPQKRAYYPYYQGSFNPQTSVYSPFSYFFGVSAPYIGRNNVYTSLPGNIYVETPRYSGLSYVGGKFEVV